MMRGFAHVGLVALIDEATGYQAERARDELHRILEQYISKELLPWTKKFPTSSSSRSTGFTGWRYDSGNTQRSGYVGQFINRFVGVKFQNGERPRSCICNRGKCACGRRIVIRMINGRPTTIHVR